MDLDGCVRGQVAVAQPACQNHGAMVLTGTMVLRHATNISKLADASKSAVVTDAVQGRAEPFYGLGETMAVSHLGNPGPGGHWCLQVELCKQSG